MGRRGDSVSGRAATAARSCGRVGGGCNTSALLPTHPVWDPKPGAIAKGCSSLLLQLPKSSALDSPIRTPAMAGCSQSEGGVVTGRQGAALLGRRRLEA